MDRIFHHRPRSSNDMWNGADDNKKPQLPNFDHFVRTVGHPDLAHRGPFRLETAFGSPPSGHTSLPTPPSTSGHRASWLSNDGRPIEHQSAIIDDNDVPLNDNHRRASLVLPLQPQCQPRPARAYSSNTPLTQAEAQNWHRQVVNEADLPGRGTCYVYDDGSVCPKEINGDIVNPRWGTTKAGKPRKRLSQACSSCREKKIRCDGPCGPGLSKCSQCLRSNRTCIFQGGTNSRQGYRSPKLAKSTGSPGTASVPSPKEFIVSRKSSLAPTEASTPTDVVHQTFSKSSEITGETSSPTMTENPISDAPTPHKKRKHLDHAVTSGCSASTDPMTSHSRLSREYIELFLTHVNVPTFEIFPPNKLMQWAAHGSPKSILDHLVLYAIMALGSVHGEGQSCKLHRRDFKDAIYSELHQVQSKYCLQSVHVLLFLAFVEFADGEDHKAFSTFTRCMGAIAYLRLNVERSSQDVETAYGFSRAIYAECCRRTYFAAACTDAFAGIAKGDPRILQNHDIFLRLPCSKDLYEQDSIPVMPCFDPDFVVPRNVTTQEYASIGEMTWLLQIAFLCSEVQLNVWRHENSLRIGRPYIGDRSVREKLRVKLDWWEDAYNQARRLHGNMDVRDNSSNNRHRNNRSRTSVGLDLLFHYAHMELNKRVRHHDLSEKEIIDHAKEANIHAIEVLKLVHQVQEESGLSTRDVSVVTRGVLTGYAIHTAIDIITAAGKTADILQPQSKIMSLMWSSSQLLEQLSTWWTSAKVQHGLVKDRIQLVWQKAQAAASEQKPYFYCSHPMVYLVDTNFDLIYGPSRKQYLKAAYGLSTVPNDSEIFSINTKGKEIQPRLSD